MASDLRIKITADSTELKKGLDSASTSVGATMASIGAAAAGAAASLAAIGLAAGTAFKGLGAALDFTSQGVKLAATAEQVRVSFEVMLGSAKKASSLMGQLVEFAAKTPFKSEEITNAARTLVAYGVESEKVVTTLTQLGDVASGLGMPLGDLASIYGKIMTNGRIMGDDMRQLQERGIPMTRELANHFGVAEGAIRKMVEEGKVGFADLNIVFQNLTKSGGMFSGMMEKQSGTFNGLLSTLEDTFEIMQKQFGEPFMQALKPAIQYLTESLEGMTGTMASLGEYLGESLGTAVTALADKGPWEFVATAASEAFGKVFSPDGPLMQYLSELFNAFAEFFTDPQISDAAYNLGKRIADGFLEKVKIPGLSDMGIDVSVKQVVDVASRATPYGAFKNGIAALGHLSTGRLPPSESQSATDSINVVKQGVDTFGRRLGEANQRFSQRLESATTPTGLNSTLGQLGYNPFAGEAPTQIPVQQPITTGSGPKANSWMEMFGRMFPQISQNFTSPLMGFVKQLASNPLGAIAEQLFPQSAITGLASLPDQLLNSLTKVGGMSGQNASGLNVNVELQKINNSRQLTMIDFLRQIEANTKLGTVYA